MEIGGCKPIESPGRTTGTVAIRNTDGEARRLESSIGFRAQLSSPRRCGKPHPIRPRHMAIERHLRSHLLRYGVIKDAKTAG
jgi:hypothetical protein